jgi:hypothetical protein
VICYNSNILKSNITPEDTKCLLLSNLTMEETDSV